MKSHRHPEFIIFERLQSLRAKYPDIPELDDLVQLVRRMINENTLSLVQDANLYALLGEADELTPGTRRKVAGLMAGAGKLMGVDESKGE